jgi:hypothetical protein
MLPAPHGPAATILLLTSCGGFRPGKTRTPGWRWPRRDGGPEAGGAGGPVLAGRRRRRRAGAGGPALAGRRRRRRACGGLRWQAGGGGSAVADRRWPAG